MDLSSTVRLVIVCCFSWTDNSAIDVFWADLTPERAFLARVFVAHCIATKDDARLEAALPVVTSMAFRIQSGYNSLLEDIEAEEDRDKDNEEDIHRREDDRMDREFVIGEMLKLAVDLDYADEIGRRKMFQLVRESPVYPVRVRG